MSACRSPKEHLMSDVSMSSLPLSRHAIDRDGVARARSGLLAELAASADARVLVLGRRGALVRPGTGDAPLALALRAPHDLPVEPMAYLGRTTAVSGNEAAGTAILLALVSDDEVEAGEGETWGDLRIIATDLDDRDAGLFTEALALANWHRSAAHSPRTGEETVVEHSGWMRRAPSDDHEVFPRTDPAVIVAVLDDRDRLLLGSNAMWQSNRYSLLAGFVEAGESLEAAVLREIHEESGMRITEPRYLGSQPWPFPRSLMVGFEAHLAEGQDPEELLPDGDEILDLRWFTRDELRGEAADLILPGPSSIARAIIDSWIDRVPA
jgi:NAD+ diphosphatase